VAHAAASCSTPCRARMTIMASERLKRPMQGSAWPETSSPPARRVKELLSRSTRSDRDTPPSSALLASHAGRVSPDLHGSAMHGRPVGIRGRLRASRGPIDRSTLSTPRVPCCTPAEWLGPAPVVLHPSRNSVSARRRHSPSKRPPRRRARSAGLCGSSVLSAATRRASARKGRREAGDQHKRERA
jgi:hypothetical protein